MITVSALGKGGQEGLVQAYRDNLAGPVPNRLTSTLAEAVHVVALLGLVGPTVDVLLGDGLAVHCFH